MAPDRLPDPLAVALEVAGILERLGIPYLAAGSLASSVHGEPRSTNDVDLVVDLAAGHVPGLLRALGDRYYVSADAVGEATRTGGTFNLIHLATAVKVDVFVSRDDPFDAERLARRTRVRIGPDEGDVLAVARRPRRPPRAANRARLGPPRDLGGPPRGRRPPGARAAGEPRALRRPPVLDRWPSG
jgi:hypothetical protein